MDQKKAAELPPLSETPIAPDTANPVTTILELDELWLFVAKKTNQAWIWIALCRESRKAGRLCCRRPKSGDLLALLGGHSIDLPWRLLLYRFLDGRPSGDPSGAACSSGKETGQTAHVERWNNTLRQLLARFIRKILSLSKSLLMHKTCLHLFLHRYNLEQAIILM